MSRFIVDKLPALLAPDSRVCLDRDEAHHARKVLRMNLGEAVELFDGKGTRAAGTIESWDNGATIRLRELRLTPALMPRLEMAVAIPKGPRADDMVNQLGQLGVDQLIPLRAERSVVDPRDTKIEKFARVAIESAKQSGRDHVMQIAGPATLDEVLREPHDLRLIADPRSTSGPIVAQKLAQAARVLVLIGPEGGWTPVEIVQAERAGCLPWRIGPNVLRIETAAGAAAALVRYLT